LTFPPFTPEEIERAGRYHRPLYVSFAVDALLSLGVLAILAFTRWGDRFFDLVAGLAWWAATPVFTAMVLGASFVVGLPFAYWRGFVRERRWGFSTQSLRGWLADRAKGLAIGIVLSGVILTGLVGLARAFSGSWPAVAIPAAMALVLLLSFIAPVVLEPVFNRFRPVEDAELTSRLRELSVRAGVPVRDVLVADASRRTRKENAYVSGLGRTRRVVLYDTLLARGDPRQVELVVAHELGHRRLRHVAVGTAVGMLGTAAGVLGLWGLLKIGGVLSAAGSTGPGDPRAVPFILLAAGVFQALGLPLMSALSRRWERAADRFSLDLTLDAEVFEEAHHDLALSNLSDLDPPRLIYLLMFSHPTPPERIDMARRWVGTKEEAAATG
jgi:STE24 endopeptidase